MNVIMTHRAICRPKAASVSTCPQVEKRTCGQLLWITAIGREDRRRTGQNRPSWQRATQSAAPTNSSSEVPGNGGRTSPGCTSALGYEPR